VRKTAAAIVNVPTSALNQEKNVQLRLSQPFLAASVAAKNQKYAEPTHTD